MLSWLVRDARMSCVGPVPLCATAFIHLLLISSHPVQGPNQSQGPTQKWMQYKSCPVPFTISHFSFLIDILSVTTMAVLMQRRFK